MTSNMNCQGFAVINSAEMFPTNSSQSISIQSLKLNLAENVSFFLIFGCCCQEWEASRNSTLWARSRRTHFKYNSRSDLIRGSNWINYSSAERVTPPPSRWNVAETIAEWDFKSYFYIFRASSLICKCEYINSEMKLSLRLNLLLKSNPPPFLLRRSSSFISNSYFGFGKQIKSFGMVL